MTFVTWIVSFLGVALSKIVALFGYRLGYILGVTTIVMGLWAALYLSLRTLIFALLQPITNEWVLMSFYVFWPSDAEVMFATYWTAISMIWFFRFKSGLLYQMAGSS